MHILPQLRKLERRYWDTLAVIGVHSAKFPGEKETANVREAVIRYGIEHPVVNDHAFSVWRAYSVRAWPTLVFIDPQGKVIGKHEGEFEAEALGNVIDSMVAEFDAARLLDRRLLEYQLEAAEVSNRPLSFPGKVVADAPNKRLFIADSGHNSVLVADMTGRVLSAIGSGDPGQRDGAFADAQFNGPQGMAVDGDALYVADAGNHTIRKIDLVERTVSTIAGSGEQSLFRHQGGDALSVALNSPYDLALGPALDGGGGPLASSGRSFKSALYVAMAGFHQIWEMDLRTGTITAFAGDGREDIVDGPRPQARLAQPYGLTLQGDRLYFVDSETSAVRLVTTDPDGTVGTIVGTGLFDFGDRDGAGRSALLQHVQGIAAGDGVIYVADTYNNKIKEIRPETGEVITIAGSGKTGRQDGPARDASFNEPAGLSYADGRVYIADTNNHLVRVLGLMTGTVSTLEISRQDGR